MSKCVYWEETTTVSRRIKVDDLPKKFRDDPQKLWDNNWDDDVTDKDHLLAENFKDYIQRHASSEYLDGGIDIETFEIEED